MSKPKTMKQIKQEIANFKRRAVIETKKEHFQAVLEKGKVETADDVVFVFMGLSKKAIEKAAFREIMRLARLGYTVQEIVNHMEGRN